MHIVLDVTFNLVALILTIYQPTLAVFSTILTNHDGYTILKNFTTYTYSECYLICRRTTECDDVQVLDDKEGKNERRRCLILKKQNMSTGCDSSYNETSSKESNLLETWDTTKWRRYVIVGSVEKAITKGAEIYMLDILTKEYILSFDLKLTSHPNYDTSIIQLSNGQRVGSYGSRTPGFFFYSVFTVSSAVNNEKDYGYKYISETAKETEFQLNKWYHIQVKQIEDSKDSAQIRYSVLLDEKELQTTINTKPSSFDNLFMYMSNPWMDEQPGFMKNVHLYISKEEAKWRKHVIVGDVEKAITRGADIYLLDKLTKEYILSFDLKLTSHPNHDTSIIQLSNGQRVGSYGSRTPGFFFYSVFTVSSAVNNQKDYGYKYISGTAKETEFQLNKWYHIQVKQVEDSQDATQIRYSVLLDGKELQTTINTKPSTFDNLFLYLSNPWMDEQPGYVKNVHLYTTKDATKWRKHVIVGDVEKAITKGANIYELDKLTKEYILTFFLKLTSHPNHDTSIIQLTTGKQTHTYGSRTPALFFHSGKFSVTSAVNNEWEYGYKYISGIAKETEFKLNKWYHIQVKQIEDSQDSTRIRYSVLLDGKELQTTINTKPSSFENVKVYLSNRWIDEQPGYVKNVHLYINKEETKWKKHEIVGTVEKAITKGAKIYNLDKLTKEYILSFDLKLTSHPNHDTSIIQLTTGQRVGSYGSRTPGFFFYSVFTVSSAVNNQKDYGYKYISETAKETEFQLNKWYHIQVKQVEDSQDSTKIRYSVLLDGKELQTTINTKPSSFENVMVYLSNPWMDEQPGYVKNVHLYTIN